MIESAREHLLGTVRNRPRTVALWSTEWRDDAFDRRTAAALYGDAEPLTGLFAGLPYERWYRSAEAQLPRVLHAEQRPPADLILDCCAGSISIDAVWTWLFVLPHGAIVAGLSIDYNVDGGGLPPIADMYRDLDSDRENLALGDRAILDACCAGLPPLRMGGDFHGITMLPKGLLPIASRLDRATLMRLVSRSDEESRRAFYTVRTPPEPNRYHHMAAGVTPGASILAGHDTQLEASMVVCAVQALSAMSTLREIQHGAFEALRNLRQPEPNTIGWLAARRAVLRDLEVDLSFAVEAHLEIRLVLPSLPVEQLNAELTEALALRHGARVTASMLARLASAIDAEANTMNEERRAARAAALAESDQVARARRTAAAAGVGVAGLTALPLTFLGANIAEVPAGVSMFDTQLLPWYGVLAAIVIITVVSAVYYVRRTERRLGIGDRGS